MSGAPPPPPPPTAAADEYFYEDDNKSEQGPFTLAQLQQWFAAGFLPAHIMTRKGREGQLRPAGDYPEIAAAQPPPQMQPPPMGGGGGAAFQQGGGGGYGGGGGFSGGGGGNWNEPAPWRRGDLPRDPDLREKIEKMAEQIASLGERGVAMESTIRGRQGGNPQFSFLNGGEGADYYQSLKSGTRPDERAVYDILARRDHAKRNRDFDTADRLRADLRGLGVRCDDKERVWMPMTRGGAGGSGDGGGSTGGFTANDDPFPGTVARWREDKGFGFIKPDAGGDDVFVHHSVIFSDSGFRALGQGQPVLYTMMEENGRVKATKVCGPDGGPVKAPPPGSGGGFGGGGGGHGHGYQRDPTDGGAQVDLQRVDWLLNERNKFRRVKDFENADKVKEDLYAMGVRMDDKERTWSYRPGGGGGGFGGGFGGGPSGFGGGGAGHDYRRDDDGSVQVDERKVDELLAARLNAKRGRDFDTADRIRDELRDMGVQVFDQEKTWSARGGGAGPGPGAGGSFGNRFGPTGHDYRRDDDGRTPVDENRVNDLLARRMEAKMSRDFTTADRIRDELRGLGVEVFDKEKTWRCGGGGGSGMGGGGGNFGGGGGNFGGHGGMHGGAGGPPKMDFASMIMNSSRRDGDDYGSDRDWAQGSGGGSSSRRDDGPRRRDDDRGRSPPRGRDDHDRRDRSGGGGGYGRDRSPPRRDRSPPRRDRSPPRRRGFD